MTTEIPYDKVNKELLAKGIQGGFALDRQFPELKSSALYATTEMHTKADHDKLIAALEGVR
jgi:glycine dehydrogenase subunit 1